MHAGRTREAGPAGQRRPGWLGLGAVLLASCGGGADNQPPDAMLAEPTSTVTAGERFFADEPITFDASGSTDADDDALSFDWQVVTKPAGSAPQLSATAGPQVSLQSGSAGRYVVQVRVSDGHAAATQAVAVDVLSGFSQWYNVDSLTVTLLDAGPDRCVTVGARVTLAGSVLRPDITLVSPLWQMQAPAGSQAALTGADIASPSFAADRPGRYTLTWRTGYVEPDGQFAYYDTEDTATVDVLPARALGVAYRARSGLDVTLLRTRQSTLPGGLRAIEADLRLRNPTTSAIDEASLRLTTGDGLVAAPVERPQRRIEPGDAGEVERTDHFLLPAGSTPVQWEYDPDEVAPPGSTTRLAWCAAG